MLHVVALRESGTYDDKRRMGRGAGFGRLRTTLLLGFIVVAILRRRRLPVSLKQSSRAQLTLRTYELATASESPSRLSASSCHGTPHTIPNPKQRATTIRPRRTTRSHPRTSLLLRMKAAAAKPQHTETGIAPAQFFDNCCGNRYEIELLCCLKL